MSELLLIYFLLIILIVSAIIYNYSIFWLNISDAKRLEYIFLDIYIDVEDIGLLQNATPTIKSLSVLKKGHQLAIEL